MEKRYPKKRATTPPIMHCYFSGDLKFIPTFNQLTKA